MCIPSSQRRGRQIINTSHHTGTAAGRGVEPKEFRRILGEFATGVTVITYEHDKARRGATVNSFTSISIDPPLILISIAKTAKAYQGLRDNWFTVNVLALEQLDVALHFAGKPRSGPIDWEDGIQAPRLGASLAQIECSPWASYDGGDHVLYLGRVEGICRRSGEPLLFHGGRFRRMGLLLQDGPRVIPLDGRPFPEYVTHMHRLHQAMDHGLDVE